jgi:hypothetical protein
VQAPSILVEVRAGLAKSVVPSPSNQVVLARGFAPYRISPSESRARNPRNSRFNAQALFGTEQIARLFSARMVSFRLPVPVVNVID